VGVTGIWTPERRDLQLSLERLDPTLAGLYGYGLDLLEQPAGRMERLVLIAHCVRELVNNLPEALGDVDGVPTRVDMTGPCLALAKEWEKHPDLFSPMATTPGDASSSGEDLVGPQVMTMPEPVVAAVYQVVVATQAGTGNAKLRHSAVVLGRLEHGYNPTLRMWQDAIRFFMKYVHLDKDRRVDVPPDAVILGHLQTIETILRARLGRFFRTVDELADLRARANRRRRTPPPSGEHTP
jgi:hypothetical protein